MPFKNLSRFFEKFAPLPCWCLYCGEYAPNSIIRNLCDECYFDLPFWNMNRCPLCSGFHKGTCIYNKTWRVLEFQTVFAYEKQINQLLATYKYSKDFLSGKILTDIVKARLGNRLSLVNRYDFVLPVPTNSRKLYLRGFNPAAKLAVEIFAGKVNLDLAKKNFHTKDQASLGRKDRIKLSELKVFSASPKVKGKRILVFDDVCTSGTTLKTLIRELYKRGADGIGVFVLAKRP